MGEHISYRPREEKGHSFVGRELKDARRPFGQDVERRSFKESRAQRSWNQDDRPLKRENLSTKFKNDHLYSSKMNKYGGIRKRVAEIDEPEPSSKRLRLNDVGRFRGMMQKRYYESSHDKHALSSDSEEEVRSKKESRDKHREILEPPSEKTRVSKKRTTSTSKHSKERSRSGSLTRQDIKDKRKRKDSEKEKVKDDKELKDRPITKEEVEEETIRLKTKDDPKKESSRKFSSDEEESPHEKKKKKKERSPSGMQVTIRSDGERAVNNDGHVKSRLSSGKVFVDLRCPHCPGHTSVTFQEYRFHLETGRHNYFLNNMINKHSIVLRRMRLQQRNEQREIEEKLEKENPEEFASFVSKYCHTCKLAFKVNEEDIHEGYAEHNATKLHKMQKTYLFPRCVMCRMSFPSRLVYEYHVASIRHLRMKTITMEHTGKETVGKIEGDEVDFATEEDLANFVTMDSVGEDEEIGSEHDEITGNREDVEAAEQEAKADDEEEEEDEEDEYFDEENLDEEDCNVLRRRAILEEDPVELDLTTESEHLEDLKDVEILGRDYICAIEASYCKLCNKAIRTDSSIGIEAIDQHCRTSLHLDNYHYLQSEEFMDEHGEGFEEANRLEEDYLADEDEEEMDNADRKGRDIIEDSKDFEKKDVEKLSVNDIEKVDTLKMVESERQDIEDSNEEESMIAEINIEEVKGSVSSILKEEDLHLTTDSSVESKKVDPVNLFEEIGEQLEETEVKNTRDKAKQVKTLKEEPKAKDSGSTKKPLKLTRRKTIPTKLSSKT